MSTVTRNVTTSTRFGKVITYHVVLDGVTFTAERMVGVSEDYSVSTHVGHCGHSGRYNVATVPGGYNVSGRFFDLARALRLDPANFTDADHCDGASRSASLCTDEEACGRWRVTPPTDNNEATPADRERARVAGIYAYNVGRPNVWHDDPAMRRMIDHAAVLWPRDRILVGIFETQWESCADYDRKRAADREAVSA